MSRVKGSDEYLKLSAQVIMVFYTISHLAVCSFVFILVWLERFAG